MDEPWTQGTIPPTTSFVPRDSRVSLLCEMISISGEENKD